MANEKLASRKALYRAIAERGSNCVEGDAEKWCGGALPSEAEAARLCEGCPVFMECRRYLKSGEPTWGVWAGERVDKFGLERREWTMDRWIEKFEDIMLGSGLSDTDKQTVEYRQTAVIESMQDDYNYYLEEGMSPEEAWDNTVFVPDQWTEWDEEWERDDV